MARPSEPPNRPTPTNVIFFQRTQRVSGFGMPDSSRELPPMLVGALSPPVLLIILSFSACTTAAKGFNSREV
jgi:hypothetical protein